MIIKYIFIKTEYANNKHIKTPNKTLNLLDLENPIYTMVKELFEYIEEDTFAIDIDGTDFHFKYECLNISKGSYYIRFETKYTPEKNAKILHKVDSILKKGEHRKEFKIISSIDEASEYYCEMAFPIFGTFERKIRNLIYNILIPTFGERWVDEVVSDEIKNELSARQVPKNKWVEDALHELTIEQLERLLFIQYREVCPSQLIDTELSVENINQIGELRIMEILSRGRPASLWDRYFADSIEIVKLDEKLQSIRGYRNKVAHNKYFNYTDLKGCREILNPLIKDLDLAIEITENRAHYKIDFENIPGMSNLLETITNTMKAIQEASNITGIEMTELAKIVTYLPKQLDTSTIAKTVLLLKHSIDAMNDNN